MHCNKYFNSIKVRLERSEAEERFRCPPYFNSIKVRLELKLSTDTTAVLAQFQFHKGTIRTPLNLRRRCPQNLWVCECKDTKKSSEKCRCIKIFFLQPYDNLPIYGGLNKSKSTFGVFA